MEAAVGLLGAEGERASSGERDAAEDGFGPKRDRTGEYIEIKCSSDSGLFLNTTREKKEGELLRRNLKKRKKVRLKKKNYVFKDANLTRKGMGRGGSERVC